MADNITIPASGTGTATPLVSTEEVTTLNGGAVSAQHAQRVLLSMRTADATAVDALGDATYGQDVDVTRMPATFAEDAAHTTGDLGVQMLTVRKDTPAATAGSDGDYQPPTTDALGRLHVASPSCVRSSVTPTIGASLYTAGDLFGTVMTFSNAALANGGCGRVLQATITNRDTEQPLLELWLFRASPTMVNADNGVFEITDANLETADLLGVVEFSAWWTNGAAGVVSQGVVRGMPLGGAPLHYVCGASSTAIYGVFAIRNGVTPASTSDVVVTLLLERL